MADSAAYAHLWFFDQFPPLTSTWRNCSPASKKGTSDKRTREKRAGEAMIAVYPASVGNGTIELPSPSYNLAILRII